MKYTYWGIIVFMALEFTSCQPVPATTNALFLIDITDTTITQQIDIEKTTKYLFEILQFNPSEIYNNGFSIDFSTLSDRYTNPIIASISLPVGGSIITQITKDRIEQQQELYPQIHQVLDQIKKSPNQQTKTSNLYTPIVNGIKEITKLGGEKQYLIIFSDLMHHSHTGGSLYSDTTAFLELVKKTNYKVPATLEIIVVFRPKTVAKDKHHTEIIQPLWKKALDGANIKFLSQL